MSTFLRLFSVRAASLACAMVCATGNASATKIFSENFSQAEASGAGTYVVGPILNTGFFVTAGNVEIGGPPASGSSFGCGNNTLGNCLDLIGDVRLLIDKTVSIRSNSVFNLVANQTYTIALGAKAQGVVSPIDFTVSLGSFSATLTAPVAGAALSASYTPQTAENGVFLSFTSLTNLDNRHGPILDNISLSTVAAVPEPGAFAMFAAGLGLLGLVRRRVARPGVPA